MHSNEKWLQGHWSNLGYCHVRCDFSAAVKVNSVNIKGQKRNFILGSSTKLEKPVLLHQWIRELISKSVFHAWARATLPQTAHMSGNRPHNTKPEEWSPKGWGSASSPGLKTKGKARSSYRCQSQGPLQTGKGRTPSRSISYSSWGGQVVSFLMLAMSNTPNSDVIPLFYLLTDFSSFPKIIWGNLKFTALIRVWKRARFTEESHQRNRAQKNNFPLTRRTPHLPVAVRDTGRCASTDWMDRGPVAASQTRTTLMAIVLTGSFFHQNYGLAFHTQIFSMFHSSVCWPIW